MPLKTWLTFGISVNRTESQHNTPGHTGCLACPLLAGVMSP